MRPFENIVGKGKKAGYKHFLLFPQCFYYVQNKFNSLNHVYFVFANAFNLDMV